MTQVYVHDPMHYKVEINELDLNTSHRQILLKIPENSLVLDIGCACGDLGAYMAKYKHCIVYGMEYDAGSIALAKKKGVYTHIDQIDLNAFSRMPSSFPVTFDRIIFADVLEHLNEPVKVLKKFLPFLDKKGRIVVSLPNIAHVSIIAQLLVNKFNYTDYGILDKTHIRFFTYESIASFSASIGLKIISTARIIHAMPDIAPYIPVHLLPSDIMNFITSNPHSYVMQYVFEAFMTDVSYEELILHNLEQLNLFTEYEKSLISTFRESEDDFEDEISTPPPQNNLITTQDGNSWRRLLQKLYENFYLRRRKAKTI